LIKLFCNASLPSCLP